MFLKGKKSLILILCFLCVTVFSKQRADYTITSLDLQYGVESYDNGQGVKENFFRIRFLPEFQLLPDTRLGLDLSFIFDKDGSIKTDHYQGDTGFWSKINFIEHGVYKSEKYIRAGFLEKITIGNGSIFNNYSNITRYPEKPKKSGLIARIENKHDDGYEFMMDDLSKPSIFAIRKFIMPVDDVVIGLTYAMDRKPDSIHYTSESVKIYGLDFITPIYLGFGKNIYLYEDLTRIKGHGSAFTTGLKYDSNSGFKAKVEFNSYSSNFIPKYFDTYYEAEKDKKFQKLRYIDMTGGKRIRSLNLFAQKQFGSFLGVELFTEYFDRYDLSPTLKLNVGLKDWILPEGLKVDWEYYNKNVDYSNFHANRKNSDVYIKTDFTYTTPQGAELTVTRKRLVNEKGNVEYLTSFMTGFKLK
ncbi:MAG: hypothetical protein WC002_10390 [Candidatus Muiribacteriota bacterium]